MISKDLVAASSRPIILSILARNESYGYELIKEVHRLSNDELQWKDGMLYPVLRKMENEELIESFWKESETGRRRKYYKIKSTGKAYLADQRKQWSVVNSVLNQLWEVPACSS